LRLLRHVVLLGLCLLRLRLALVIGFLHCDGLIVGWTTVSRWWLRRVSGPAVTVQVDAQDDESGYPKYTTELEVRRNP